jgi:twitching motility protein PilT
VSAATKIQQLLAAMKTHGASDLHLKAGLPPTFRVKGHLKSVNLPAMSGDDIAACLTPIIPEGRRPYFEAHGNLDFAAEIPDGDRFRVNLFRASGKMGAAIRRVNPVIPTYAELHLPPIYEKIVGQTYEGVLLVCGVTGSGKSTTLACMVEQINSTRSDNIITLEDPIEYQFKPKKSIVSQREVGVDFVDFVEGLRGIVRQDPDTVFIGELRDLVTMRAAIQAAETGHLVFASMHSADTTQAFARLLEFFPENERSFVRTALTNTLRAIFAQRLLPGAREDSPLVPATEVLINTGSLKEMIRKEQENEILDLIAGSEKEGMHSFTSSLAQLVEEDWVFMDTAMQYAPNPEALASRLRGIKASGQTMVQRSR